MDSMTTCLIEEVINNNYVIFIFIENNDGDDGKNKTGVIVIDKRDCLSELKGRLIEWITNNHIVRTGIKTKKMDDKKLLIDSINKCETICHVEKIYYRTTIFRGSCIHNRLSWSFEPPFKVEK